MDSLDQKAGVADPNGQPAVKGTRINRACDLCRSRKIKCTGGSPDNRCRNCEVAGVSCTWEAKATKRAPPKGYVESLERRIDQLELLLMEKSGTTSTTRFPMSMTDQEGSSPESLHSIDALGADFQELSVDKDRYVGRGSGLHLARSIEAYTVATDSQPAPVMITDTSPSPVEVLMQEEHRARSLLQTVLPPDDLSLLLVNAYFSCFNDSFALLHRPSFDRAFDSGLMNTDTSFRSLLFMIFAIGSRFVNDERVVVPPGSDPSTAQHARGFEFWKAGSSAASPSLVSSTLYDIEASCLSLFWLCGSASPISAWAAVGSAVRRAVDVGVHMEKRSSWDRSPLRNELRKRAFYMLYGLDRIFSVLLGRPLALQDSDFDVELPLDISDIDLDVWNNAGYDSPPPPRPSSPTPISGARCLSKLHQLMGKVFAAIFSPKANVNQSIAIAELDSMLNEWLGSIPEHLRWNPETQDPRWLTQSSAIYGTYYSVQILIHRDKLHPSPTTSAPTQIYPSLAICSNAARSIAHVLSFTQSAGKLDPLFWLSPMQLITSSLILLISVLTKNPNGHLTASAIGDIAKCTAALGHLAPKTFIANKCFLGLSRFAKAAIANQPLPTTMPSPAATSPTSTLDGSVHSRKRGTLDDLDSSSTGSTSHSPTSDAAAGPEYPSISTNGVPVSRTSRTKTVSTSSTARRHRVPSQLPTSTSDLSLQTFRGYQTYELPLSPPVLLQDSLSNSLFSWPQAPPLASSAPSGMANAPPMAFPQQGAGEMLLQQNNGVLSPGTIAMFGGSTTYFPESYDPQQQGQASKYSLASSSASMGYGNSSTGFGIGSTFPFSFDAPSYGNASGMATGLGGDVTDGTIDWATGFDFNAFTQSFMGSQ